MVQRRQDQDKDGVSKPKTRRQDNEQTLIVRLFRQVIQEKAIVDAERKSNQEEHNLCQHR